MQWKNVTKTNWTVYDSTGRATDLLANYFPCISTLFKIQDPKNHILLSSTYLFWAKIRKYSPSPLPGNDGQGIPSILHTC